MLTSAEEIPLQRRLPISQSHHLTLEKFTLIMNTEISGADMHLGAPRSVEEENKTTYSRKNDLMVTMFKGDTVDIQAAAALTRQPREFCKTGQMTDIRTESVPQSVQTVAGNRNLMGNEATDELRAVVSAETEAESPGNDSL